MNILMVTNALSEGGVESFFFFLSYELVMRKHTVSILVLNRNKLGLKEKFENHGIRIIPGKYGNIYNPLNIILIRKHIRKYQIVHIHLFPVQLFAALAVQFMLKKNFRFLTTEHSTYNNRRKYLLLKYLDKYFYSQYDKIICISEQTEKNLRLWLSDESDKICTVNNGIDVDKFRDAVKEERWGNDTVYLAMVGRFEYPKDQSTVIKAMKKMPGNVHLLLIGSGDGMPKCKRLAEEELVKERVHFLGNCTDVPSLLKSCTIGILSTVWDGFGLVAVEYMASGMPVIASDVDGLRDVVGRQELLFKTGDVEGLSKKLLWLLNDNTAYQSMKQYCINRANCFSKQKMAEEYLKCYN